MTGLPLLDLPVEELCNADMVSILIRCEEIFKFRLKSIPEETIVASGKPENAAKLYYEGQGFKVYKSKVKGGYRCIGALDYWKSFRDKLDVEDENLISLLQQAVPDQIDMLVLAVKQKAGTPDLLLVKDNKISFVEVKAENETVKLETIKFDLYWGHFWPVSILRVKSR